jgi:beta-phosphoglucomutase-like phosphatase (HAD superfamily)
LPSFDDSHFDAIVAGDEVAAKKPSPEVFEIALRQLRLHASSCVVFEDSSNGVTAAQRAPEGDSDAECLFFPTMTSPAPTQSFRIWANLTTLIGVSRAGVGPGTS